MLEQVKGIEPSLSAWQAEVLTAILHLHGISGARAGPALSSVTTPESGGQDWNRTRNLLITNQLHCQLCYLAILVSQGIEPCQCLLYTLKGGHTELPGSAPETMERVTGIEPVYPVWKTGALADVLHPHLRLTSLNLV